MPPRTASRPDASCITRSSVQDLIPGGAIIIDRCVCTQVLFSDILPQARAHGWDLARLTTATGCGAQCGLCRPYLDAMLRDQVTVFHALLPPLVDVEDPA